MLEGRAGEGASSCCAKHRRILAHRQRVRDGKSSCEHHSSAKKTSGKRNRAAPRSPANSQCSAWTPAGPHARAGRQVSGQSTESWLVSAVRHGFACRMFF